MRPLIYLYTLFCYLFCAKSNALFFELPMVIVVPSYNNEKWCAKNLTSILHQHYDNYRILYVDDASCDQTVAEVENLLKKENIDYRIVEFDPALTPLKEDVENFILQINKEQHFFTLIRNKNRTGALANLYRMIHSCKDNEIIVTVDGDDWLSHENVLNKLNQTYQSATIWFTHGTLQEFPWGHVAWCEPVAPHVVEKNAFREFKCPTHLRTFYAWLFKKIALEDLLYEGNFFPMTWDMAIMYPIAEMAAERHAFIKDVTYIYNMSNPINDNQVNAQLQNHLDSVIRKKPRYQRLEDRPNLFDKIVIWGHKLHSHTHSYIHYGFYTAYKHLGYPTFWFDDADDVSDFDFSHALFLTEGQVDKNIPLRDDCLYMLHNCVDKKYQRLNPKNVIAFQVFTKSVSTLAHLVKIDTCIYYDLEGRCIYMPWATDLLPHEIEEVKSSLTTHPPSKQITWVGTMGDGKFGNINELSSFIKACTELGFTFSVEHNLSTQEHKQAIASSYLAPAIVGQWQQEQGYIPCRIFKNISYGKMGITNSWHVYELLERKIVYNPDTYSLCYDAMKKMDSLRREELFELMDLVKAKHTYVQRSQMLLDFISLVHAHFS